MFRLLMKVTLAAFLLAIIVPATVSADDKIVYFDGRRIVNEYQGFIDAQKELEREALQWKDELDSLDSVVRQLRKEIEQEALFQSDATKIEREKEIEQKELEFRRIYAEITDPGGRHDQRSAELSKPIYDKVYQVLESLAIEEGYTMVFDLVNITWAKPELDITDLILEELNKLE